MKSRVARRRLAGLFKVLQLENKINIVDVGANPTHAPPYKLLQERLEEVEVFGFEPNAVAYAKLMEQDNLNRTYFQAAVGKKGKATFYSHHISSLSSLFPIHAPSAKFLGKEFWTKRPVEKIPVDLVSLDTVTELPNVDMLKMDLQGGELGVLQGGKKKLKDAMVVIPEVRFYRMYEGEPMWAEVDQELRKQGFVLHKISHAKSVRLATSQKSKLRGKGLKTQLLDGDAVYIRNLDAPEKITDEQWKKLALLADGAFCSYDLACLCLDELVRRGLIDKSIPKKYVNKVLKGLDS